MRTPPAGIAGAFTRAEALAAGWTPAALDHAHLTGGLLRAYHGVYLPSQPSALARAGAVVLASGGTASHLTAARVHGLWLVDEGEWATVPTAVHRRRDERFRLVREDLSARDLVRMQGVPVTTVAKTVRDLCRRAGRLQAVCALESALRSGAVDEALLASLKADASRSVRARAGSANALSESPLETAVRLLLTDAGIPVTPQVLIRDRNGAPAARIDLKVTGSPIAIECDGQSVHGAPDPLYRDRIRANAVASSVVFLRFTWADLRRDGYVVATVRQALTDCVGHRRRRGHPAPPRLRTATG